MFYTTLYTPENIHISYMYIYAGNTLYTPIHIWIINERSQSERLPPPRRVATLLQGHIIIQIPLTQLLNLKVCIRHAKGVLHYTA